MRWEDERYVRLFTRDTTTWLMWSWQARFVFMSLLRKVDRAGMIDVGAYGLRGLSVAIGVPSEIVEPGMKELTADGTVKQAGSTYVIPNFLAAQECSQSDKARQSAKRERDRVKAVDESSVTERDAAVTDRDVESQIVTESHSQSHAVTPRHTPSLRAVPSVPSVPKSPQGPPQAGGASASPSQEPDPEASRPKSKPEPTEADREAVRIGAGRVVAMLREGAAKRRAADAEFEARRAAALAPIDPSEVPSG